MGTLNLDLASGNLTWPMKITELKDCDFELPDGNPFTRSY